MSENMLAAVSLPACERAMSENMLAAVSLPACESRHVRKHVGSSFPYCL
jgi:hypothetical protein